MIVSRVIYKKTGLIQFVHTIKKYRIKCKHPDIKDIVVTYKGGSGGMLTNFFNGLSDAVTGIMPPPVISGVRNVTHSLNELSNTYQGKLTPVKSNPDSMYQPRLFNNDTGETVQYYDEVPIIKTNSQSVQDVMKGINL